MTDSFEGTDQTCNGAEKSKKGCDVCDRRKKRRSLLNELRRLANCDLKSVLNQGFWLMSAHQTLLDHLGCWFFSVAIAVGDCLVGLTGDNQIRELVEKL